MEAETSTTTAPPVLTPGEVRVLGCLIEKSYTTPDSYPMSLNSLQNACNQKSSRHPIVQYDENMVDRAVEGLRAKGWATLVHTAGGRTRKFKHEARHKFQFTDGELGILCVLMLRGIQSLGELRSRTDRIVKFSTLSEAEEATRELERGYPTSFVRQLPRAKGQKDPRFTHLLCGEPDNLPLLEEPDSQVSPAGLESRVSRLESELHTLRDELDSVRKILDEFREQFR